jgi:hypothetical protein
MDVGTSFVIGFLLFVRWVVPLAAVIPPLPALENWPNLVLSLTLESL